MGFTPSLLLIFPGAILNHPIPQPHKKYTTHPRHHLSIPSIEVKILLYIQMVILRLNTSPTGSCSSKDQSGFKFCHTPQSLPTLWSLGASTTTFTTFFFACPTGRQFHCQYDQKRDTAWEIFPELSENLREQAMISLISSSVTCTSTSSTNHNSIFLVTNTTIVYTQPHTSDYQYNNTTTFSNSTSSSSQSSLAINSKFTSTTTFAPNIFRKQSRSRNKN